MKKSEIRMDRIEEVHEKALRCEITRTEAAEMLGVSPEYMYKYSEKLGLADIDWKKVNDRRYEERTAGYMEYAVRVSNGEITLQAASDMLNIKPHVLKTWMDKKKIPRPQHKKRAGKGNPCCECAEHYCEWLLYGKPVPGWEAEKVMKRYGVESVEGYAIVSCPKYRKMEKKIKKRR